MPFRIYTDFQKPRQLLFQRLQHVPHVRFSPFDGGCSPQRPCGVVGHLRKDTQVTQRDALRHLCPALRAARSQELARNCLIERSLSSAYERLNRERPGVSGREASGRRGHHSAVCRCERREQCLRGSEVLEQLLRAAAQLGLAGRGQAVEERLARVSDALILKS